MNKGSKKSRGGGGGGGNKAQQYSWQPKPSITPSTPVGVDVSPSGSVSSTSDVKTHSPGPSSRRNYVGSINQNVTPVGRQQGGWSNFGSGSGARQSSPSSTSSNDSSFRCDEQFGSRSSPLNPSPNSGGSINQNVTPAGRQGGGWSTFGSGGSSRGGGVRQSSATSTSSNDTSFRRGEQFGSKSDQMSSREKDVGARESSPLHLDCAFMKSLDHPPDVGQPSEESVHVKSFSEVKIPENSDSTPENDKSECSIVKFDICLPPKAKMVVLKASLFSKNREMRKASVLPTLEILRPGMVLLKNYLSLFEQADILKICRHHGLETVGFNQPTFGAEGKIKMHLKLMCFGKFWNPETNKYGDVREIDNAKPPPIPRGFMELVDRAIKDSQSFISEKVRGKNVESVLPSVKPDICLVNYYSKTGRLGLHQRQQNRELVASSRLLLNTCDRAIKDSQSFISEKVRGKNVESVLPSVKPDICLVNYYSKTGRLGLHQDKDESRESLEKAIPIVSFSIGDSAEFLYSDQNDPENANKVELESGDVLIFGGKSRHIFHGVTQIKPDTAPKTLLEETNFRSGRLNLTFRQQRL